MATRALVLALVAQELPMLKSTVDIKKALVRLYDNVWAQEAAGCPEKAWPQQIPLGKCSKQELDAHFLEVCAAVDALCSFAASLELPVTSETRLVGGTKQNIPTHIVVENREALVQAVSEKAAFVRAQERANRLRQDFPQLSAAEIALLLRKMAQVAPLDIDFDLACRAGAWFRENAAQTHGLTARQVPLVGFHAKWLDVQGRRGVVAQLAGLEMLPLEQRPAQVRFTYLDPAYLARGGRRFDSWVVGDACELPYEPRVVIICENRDSALWFPQVEGGIAVMGDGFAAIQNVAALGWVRTAPAHASLRDVLLPSATPVGASSLSTSPSASPSCSAAPLGAPSHSTTPLVVYWGDMDAAGLEILNGCRQQGINCESMLMDIPAFDRYAAFGTNSDKNGHALKPKEPLDLPGLRAPERELYLRLVSPNWHGVRRIEQERIPLPDALAALNELLQS